MPDRLEMEKRLWNEGYDRIMGLDEVGRGCLSGPVVAAGVILDTRNRIEGLRDSKAIKPAERKNLSKKIKKKALFWTIQQCSVEEIDRHNILNASLLAMRKCVRAVGADPDYLLVDGNRYLDTLLPVNCVVKGDNRSASIAAASILAKVYRDEKMIALHERYPHFGWDTNVGYPTTRHYEGLREFGITEFHRKSFNLKTSKRYRS
jgi:ribonuclease HII